MQQYIFPNIYSNVFIISLGSYVYSFKQKLVDMPCLVFQRSYVFLFSLSEFFEDGNTVQIEVNTEMPAVRAFARSRNYMWSQVDLIKYCFISLNRYGMDAFHRLLPSVDLIRKRPQSKQPYSERRSTWLAISLPMIIHSNINAVFSEEPTLISIELFYVI